MKNNLERYKSIDDLGRALGLSNADLALIHAKKQAVNKLRKARDVQGLTQAQVAKMVGTKQPAIARMEAGLISEVSFDFLLKVAWALGVTLTMKPPTVTAA